MVTANPIFEVPELLQAILERLKTSRDAGRLACVCRRLFDSCISFAWGQVSSTTQLLSLLPGVTISKRKGRNARDEIVVELPKLLTEADLARFRFYAAFVKTLNIFESTDEPIHWILLNWDWIFLHSRAQPLLPNLHTLTFTNVSERCQPAYIWFTLFLSPQLSTVESGEISERTNYFSPSEAQFILSAIADTCPRIHTLGFLATVASWVGSDVLLPPSMDHTLYYDYNPGPLFSRMKHLTTLRVELATLKLLPPGSLFSVEWLEVNVGVIFNNNSLPFSSFPYLKHFGAFHYVYDLVSTGLPSFLTTLTSLQLHFSYFHNDIHEVSSKIAEYNPCLLDLSIHPFRYSYVSGTGNRRWPLLEIATLEPLAQLTRLERFCLSDVIVVSPTQDAAEVLSYIGGSLFPNLKVLEIPHHVIPLSRISKAILHLPRLEYLSVTITEPGIVGQPGVDQPTSALRILESEFDRGLVRAARKNKLAKDADKIIAQYLASLCINLQILNRSRRLEWECSPEESTTAKRIIASINKHLSVLAPRGSTPYENVAYPTSHIPWGWLVDEL